MNEFIKQLLASASLPQLVAQATAGGSRADKGVLLEAIILIGGFVVFCIWFFKTVWHGLPAREKHGQDGGTGFQPVKNGCAARGKHGQDGRATVEAAGRATLLWSEPRRNNMHPSVPFLAMFAYFGLTSYVFSIACKLQKIPEDSWQFAFYGNVITAVSAIITGFIVILLVRESFARSLKGFGLNMCGTGLKPVKNGTPRGQQWHTPRRVPVSHCGTAKMAVPRWLSSGLRDLGAAALNFWAVWPILTAVLFLTIEIGKFIYGPDYNIERHRELDFITKYPQLLLIISIVFVAVVIAPVIEELLFRGLLQTIVRSYGYGPWLSIAISSFFFILFHANPSHWPALFVLSMGIGYSYERSGSILRPIFVHAIFNAIMVVATLLVVSSSNH